jgi:hypothetical protein
VATYVYGIVDPDAQPSGSGIAGAPLGVIALGGAGALVSDLPDGELKMGRDEVMTHSEVLERAFGHGTVLPMRFGVVMDGSDEVRQLLLERHGERLRAQLDELEGKVELHVRVAYEEEALLREVISENQDIARLSHDVRGRSPDATYYGRIRLGELISEAIDRKRERDAQEIIDALSPVSLALDVGAPTHERVVVSASFLVERKRLEQFDSVLEEIAAGQAGRMKVKLTGPRPPHSFVELAGNE